MSRFKTPLFPTSETSVEIIAPPTDLLPAQLNRVHKFIEDGMPGVAALKDTTLHQIMELYLDGKTYKQISQALRVKQDLVMFLSHKFKWHEAKWEHLSEIQQNAQAKVLEEKLTNMDFTQQLNHALRAKMKKPINKWIATGDDSMLQDLNFKDIDTYLKVTEAHSRLTAEPKAAPKAPTVNINMGNSGINIKNSDETIDISSPRQNFHSQQLQNMAEFRRGQENKHKIHRNNPKDETEGEDNE